MSSTIHALHRLRQLLKEDAPLLQTGLGPTQLLSTYKPFQAAVTAIDRLSPTASFPGHGLIIVPPAFSLYLALVPIARALQQGSRVTVLMPDAQQSEGFRQWLGATFSSETITLAVDPSAVWTALSGGAFDWLHFSGLPADWALWQDLIPSNCGYRSVLYEQAIAVIDETANLDAVSSRLVWAETDPVHPFPEPQQLFIQESIKKHCLDRIQEKLQQFHHPEIDPERVFRIRGFRSLGEVLQAAAGFQYPALGLFIFSRYKPNVMRLISEYPAIGVCLNEEVLDFEDRPIPYSSKKHYEIAAFFEKQLSKPFQIA